MKLSIGINSTILFHIFQLKLSKERHIKMSSIHSTTNNSNNNNVGTSTTNGLHKRPLAIGYKQQGPILVTLPQQQQQQSTTKIEEENNQPFRGGISEVKVAMTITTATT